MKSNRKNYIIVPIIFIIFMYIIAFIYKKAFSQEYDYFISQLAFGTKYFNFLNAFFIIGTAGILTTVTYKVFNKNISKNFIKFLYIIYFILLFFILFLKSTGLQGANLNPLEGLYDLKSGYYKEILLNIIIFIPIGFLSFGKKFSRVIVIRFIIVILLVEIFQYMFSLGFFDIVDVITNTIGFVLGHFIINLKFVRIFFEKNNRKNII